MQNLENQPEIQFTETTPNTEQQYQEQFVEKTNTQCTIHSENFEDQNNSKQILPSISSPVDNVNPLFSILQTNPYNDKKIPKKDKIDYMEQQREINYSTIPIMCHCPYCHVHKMTLVTYSMGSQSWKTVFQLCICTLVCCFIPCICSSCQDTNHFCSNCGQQVGKRLYNQSQQLPSSKNGQKLTNGEIMSKAIPRGGRGIFRFR